MVKRKSPHEHQVGHHVREGRIVRDYQRGKGDKPIRTRRSRVVGETNPIEPYDITIFYDRTKEKLNVDAKDYIGALDSGLAYRDEIQPPKIIRMRKGR